MAVPKPYSILSFLDMLRGKTALSATYDRTKHSLEVIGDAIAGMGPGSSPWDSAIADHDTEDTFGNVINDLVEEDSGTYRLTAAALAEAPGGGDATAANQTTIINAVGVVDGYHDVPTADAATDTVMRDVIGRKTDAAVTTVGTTKSVIAYLKGLVQELSQRAVPKMYQGNNSTDSYSTVVSITDKGVLTGISGRIGMSNPGGLEGFIEVTIDGTKLLANVTVANGQYDSSYYRSEGHFSIPFNHRFNTSLLVQHKVSASSYGTIYTIVTATIDA